MTKSKTRRVILDDVCDEITVGHVGPMADKYLPDGIPFLRSQNVRPFKFDPKEIKYVSPEFHTKLKKSALKPNDVVVTRTGANVGQCCIVPKELPVANCADLVILRASKELDPHYLMYVLNSPHGRASIGGDLAGAAQLHFNVGSAKRMEVTLPDLPTQRKIAGILSAYDDLIENNLRRIKILEQMAQSLYREWFVHFRFPRDPSEASAKAGGHESATFKDSELGRIPEGWEVKKLGELADINAKSIRATNAPEEIHYIDIASVSTGSIDKIDTMTFDSAPSRARRVVRHGDIIWSTVRPNRRSFSLIINPAENVIASTGFAVLSARSVPWSYLYQATTTEDFTSYLVNHASGAAYPAVNSGIFENSDIVMPPSDLLKRFNAMAEPNQVLQQNLHRRNQTLRLTRDLLLPKLLSGSH